LLEITTEEKVRKKKGETDRQREKEREREIYCSSEKTGDFFLFQTHGLFSLFNRIISIVDRLSIFD